MNCFNFQVEPKKLTDEFIKEARTDKQKMEEVIINYYPMVYKIVNKMDTSNLAGVDYNDLVSIGLDSIYKAVNRYNAEKGSTFTSYCYTYIKGYILQEINKFRRARTGDLNVRQVSIEKMEEYGYSFANMVVDKKNYELIAISGEAQPELGWKMINECLNETQKQLIKKYYVDGLGSKKLGEEYNLSQQAIHARLRTIHKQLAKKIDKEHISKLFGLY